MKGARRLVDALRAKHRSTSLGQHFLVHDDIIERTVAWAEVDVEDHVFEVGPGPGVLTEALLATGCRSPPLNLTAVRATTSAPSLRRNCRGAPHLARRRRPRWLAQGHQPGGRQHSLPDLLPLIDVITRYHRNPNTTPLQDIVMLVQEEFAERVVMEYESDVGSLGMVVALDFDADLGERVPPHAFSPCPRCIPPVAHDTARRDWPCDRRLMVQMIRAAFDQRRKKLKKTLKQPPRRLPRARMARCTWKRAYAAMEHDPRLQRRPETLELDEWADLGVDFASCEEEAEPSNRVVGLNTLGRDFS